MRKIALMVGTLLVLTAGLASAAGISLNWAKCRPDAGAQSNRSPVAACTQNSTNFGLLITSFVPPASAAAGLVGIEAYVDYQTEDGVAANCWWDFRGTNAARSGSLKVKTADPGVNGAPTFGCPSYFLTKGGGFGGGGMALLGNGNGRITMGVSIAAGTGTDPGVAEQSGPYAEIDFANGNTCAGCSKKACLTLNRMVFLNNLGVKTEVNTPTVAGSHQVTQQGGYAGCAAATPTKKATWGSVKALYR